MKDHILSGLREQFDQWEELLANLTEEQITASLFDLNWSIKDVVAHLWGWQHISITRMKDGCMIGNLNIPNGLRILARIGKKARTESML
jgi:hypothetical protein